MIHSPPDIGGSRQAIATALCQGVRAASSRRCARKHKLASGVVFAGILEGITRDAVIELARVSGRTAREAAMTKHDIYVADECFLTGFAAEVSDEPGNALVNVA